MKRYEFLDHTADAKFKAFGRTLEEAFANAALATASLMWDWGKIKKKIKHEVRTNGRDLKQLLFNFLEEIIYLLDAEMFLLGSVEMVRIQKKRNQFFLEAVFIGDKFSESYEIYGDVKAVTYNEMEIEKSRPVSIQVVVDV
jgi:SHS2 domain-containing protein